MRKVMIILVMVILGWGCSNQEKVINPNDTTDKKTYVYSVDSLWPMKIGNYWKYHYSFTDLKDWRNNFDDTLIITVENIEYGIWSKIVHVKYENHSFGSLIWSNKIIILSDSGIHRTLNDGETIFLYSYPFIEGHEYEHKYDNKYHSNYFVSEDIHPLNTYKLPPKAIKYKGSCSYQYTHGGFSTSFETYFCINFGLVYHRLESHNYYHSLETYSLIEYKVQ